MNNNSLLQPKMRLGDLLIYKEYITLEQLESALEEQANGDGNQLLGELLVKSEFCTEENVLECLALEYRIPYVQLDNRMFDSKIFELVPREFVEKHTVLPLFKVRNVLTVAVAEPTNVFLVDQLSNLTKSEIQIVAANARDIRRMVQTYMPNTNVFVIDDIIDDANGTNVELIEDSIDDIGFDVEFAGQSPIIKLVNYIVYNAVREGASDIHIEPTEQQLRIRYRIDGILKQALEPPIHLAPAVSSRIKIMASLDISERRLPQDGRIHVLMEGRPIDLRVSTLPMPTGEKVVIRILDNRSVNVSLEQLGFSAEVLEHFNAQLEKPNGIVLV
ncbi:MAG: ATPase, T2SS/T4P/T4SS family, partial [Gimesia sp.]